MIWSMYKVTFRLRSPLHVGFHKVMHFFRTRYYIPGKLIWGALTAKLTPILGISDYEQVGNWLKESFRFGYLFTAVDSELYMPKYTDEGYKLGELSQYEFEKRFINSYASAPIEPHSLSAEDGMLHEFEFLSPYKIDDKKAVNFIGFLWVKNLQDSKLKIIKRNNGLYIQYNCSEVNFQEELVNRFQVGGERTYGFGLLTLEKIEEFNDKKPEPFSGILCEKNEEIILTLKDGETIWSHLKYNENLDMKGNIEPIVGRNWEANKGSGKVLENLGLFWSPGSVVCKETIVEINEFGMWKLADKNI